MSNNDSTSTDQQAGRPAGVRRRRTQNGDLRVYELAFGSGGESSSVSTVSEEGSSLLSYNEDTGSDQAPSEPSASRTAFREDSEEEEQLDQSDQSYSTPNRTAQHLPPGASESPPLTKSETIRSMARIMKNQDKLIHLHERQRKHILKLQVERENKMKKIKFKLKLAKIQIKWMGKCIELLQIYAPDRNGTMDRSESTLRNEQSGNIEEMLQAGELAGNSSLVRSPAYLSYNRSARSVAYVGDTAQKRMARQPAPSQYYTNYASHAGNFRNAGLSQSQVAAQDASSDGSPVGDENSSSPNSLPVSQNGHYVSQGEDTETGSQSVSDDHDTDSGSIPVGDMSHDYDLSQVPNTQISGSPVSSQTSHSHVSQANDSPPRSPPPVAQSQDASQFNSSPPSSLAVSRDLDVSYVEDMHVKTSSPTRPEPVPHGRDAGSGSIPIGDISCGHDVSQVGNAETSSPPRSPPVSQVHAIDSGSILGGDVSHGHGVSPVGDAETSSLPRSLPVSQDHTIDSGSILGRDMSDGHGLSQFGGAKIHSPPRSLPVSQGHAIDSGSLVVGDVSHGHGVSQVGDENDSVPTRQPSVPHGHDAGSGPVPVGDALHGHAINGVSAITDVGISSTPRSTVLSHGLMSILSHPLYHSSYNNGLSQPALDDENLSDHNNAEHTLDSLNSFNESDFQAFNGPRHNPSTPMFPRTPKIELKGKILDKLTVLLTELLEFISLLKEQEKKHH